MEAEKVAVERGKFIVCLGIFMSASGRKKKRNTGPEKFISTLNAIRQRYLCVPKYNYCLLLKNNFP